MHIYRVRFIPEVSDSGVVTLQLHFAGQGAIDTRRFVYYSRGKLEAVFARAGLGSLVVCTLKDSGYWEMDEAQLEVLTSGSNEIWI